MGTIRQGANGGFSGKAGSVIGSSWNGIDYIKGLYRKRNKPFTEEQQMQQAKFQLMGRFLYPLKVLLRYGYGQLANAFKRTPANVAMSENLERAISGAHPAFGIDYPNVQLSRGPLLGTGDQEMTRSNELLMITWDQETSEISGHEDDLVFILFYHPESNYFFMPKEQLERGFGEAVVNIPKRLKEGEIHGWLFLTDRKRREASSTAYLGNVLLTAE